MAANIHTFRYERDVRDRWKGIRILTMRRWPMYVSKREGRAYFDTWLPSLGPSEKLRVQMRDEKITWGAFVRRYRAEMKRPDAVATIRMLASLARKYPVSVGCGCPGKQCHRFILEKLIQKAARSA